MSYWLNEQVLESVWNESKSSLPSFPSFDPIKVLDLGLERRPRRGLFLR